jgi:hypothetical protein
VLWPNRSQSPMAQSVAAFAQNAGRVSQASPRREPCGFVCVIREVSACPTIILHRRRRSPRIKGPTGRPDVSPGRSPGNRIEYKTEPQRDRPNDCGRAAPLGLWCWLAINPQAAPGAVIRPALRACLPQRQRSSSSP